MSMKRAMAMAAVCGLGLSVSGVLAQDGGGAAVEQPAEQSGELSGEQSAEAVTLPDLAPIMAWVEGVRGLKFTGPVPAEFQSRESLREEATKSLEEEWPAAERGSMMAGLTRLGMLREPLDLGEQFIEALVTQAAAYYDPEKKAFFYVAGDMDESMMAITAAHELVHALQDQVFDLEAMLQPFFEDGPGSVRQDDAHQAVRLLIEGDASWVHTHKELESYGASAEQMLPMVMRMYRGMTLESLKEMAAMAGQMGGEDAAAMMDLESLERLPRYITEPMLSHYMQGPYFVHELVRAGGLERVNAAFAAPPRSTEQALHPEKFIGPDIDEPTPIDLGELASFDGWERIDAAVHGQAYLGIMLTNFGLPALSVSRATQGWDGDVYHAYRSEDGRVAVVLATVWDTERDAREFVAAFRETIAVKHPGTEIEQVLDGEQRVVGYRYTMTRDPLAKDEAGDAGETGMAEGLIKREGDEVVLVEGLPGEGLDAAVAEALGVAVEKVK